MRVLFTHSYFYKLDPKQWKARQPYPPLGTLWAAAVAREIGMDVSLFDSGLMLPDDFGLCLRNEQPNLVVIFDDGFNYLTKMCLTVMREAAFRMIRESREAGVPVVVCNSDSSDHFDLYLRQGAMCIIRGEGEETLKEVLHSLQTDSPIKHVPGTISMDGENVVAGPPRAVLRELDNLPIPAWDLVKMEDYRNIWMKAHGYFSLNVATTRGCPYKCNWCAKPIYGNRYNSRSPGKVAEEIAYLTKTYRVRHFWMCDDIFGLKPGWLKAFADEVQNRQLSFRYKIQSRADLLEPDVVTLLKKSGAETVWMGAESGSQEILDAMDKGITLGQIQNATALLKKQGIRVGYFIQFGYHGEQKADVEKTIKLVVEQMPDEIGVSVSYPLPGTRFYEKVKMEMKGKQNWTDSDDLALMYKNTYSPAYYRVLHRYLHGRFRIQRSIYQLKRLITRPVLPGLGIIKSLVVMIIYFPITLVRGYRLRLLQR
ncbi:MAG: B12-binding domain-containing radical SAM protein [Bacteroidetes bacterium]|nr:B12-binding domain-containing radical SAM protein [Bacteroidota bacterium]